MLTLRYHLVSLVAVFLALAVGVVLGSTGVSHNLLAVVAGDREQLTKQIDALSAQRSELEARQRAANGFTATVAPSVVKGQLDQRKVVLVTAADADPVDRDAVRQLVTDAGGAVTGELSLTEAITDPTRADAIRDLSTRLLPSGAQLPAATDAGGLVGGLLGSVLLTKANGQANGRAADQGTAAITGLTEAGFLRAGAKPAPAQLAVVLTGGGLAGPDSAERAATLARLAGELDRVGGGAVLAGRTGVERATGAVGVVRADPTTSSTLSTVDDVQTAVGRVATVLALREQAEGRAGRYGEAANAQAPIPGASTG
ncbi:copper transporter [Pseudonocardia acaciae]|uniref:copper transporter n=1 Tax=Pseudonocardia acaciae TaxID=551276 RepID=UPI000491837A|nr:copper transporter [Pseudonocardia acaciae]